MEITEYQEQQIVLANMERRKELLKTGVIILNEEFNKTTGEAIYFQLESAIKDKTVEKVQLNINSNGGQITSLMAMVDLIESSPKPVVTHCFGYAYSAGALLLMAGTKGHRTMIKRGLVLIHDVATSAAAKNSQFQVDAEHLKQINVMLKKFILERTKMTSAQVTHFMDRNIDEFLTPEQALKYGIIDKIV